MENKLKVLFVSSGNSKDFEIAPFIKSQGESLRLLGIDIKYFPVIGKGLFGYLKNIVPLKKFIIKNDINLIHAHFGLCGLVALLSFAKLPIILSLMGDDAYGSYKDNGKLELSSIYLIIISKMLQPFVKKIIVKSENIAKTVYLKKKMSIIPNGIDLKFFKLIDNKIAKAELGFSFQEKLILFLGDPHEPRKNFNLLNMTIKLIRSVPLKVITPYPVPHQEIVTYLNAADVTILTSTQEGSPNVIKEAMASNCPIVSTKVGDTQNVIGETEGCYMSSFDEDDLASKIKLALQFSEIKGRTKGRERLIDIGLDSESIGRRIISIYKQVLTN